MEIVDAHVHFWTPDTHSWVHLMKGSSFVKDAETYLPSDYKRDIGKYNVTKCIHVEACWPGNPVDETKWLVDLSSTNCKYFPNGYADLSLSNTQDILDGHCQSKLMRGIRHLRHFNPYDLDQEDQTYLLSDPNWLAGLKLLEKFNLSFQHHFLPHQMAVGAEVAAKFPKIKFMIDHCGLPNNKNETSISDWKEGLLKLAKEPNVYCKVSGLFLDPLWTEEFVSFAISTCIDIFGIHRCVFASDFPVDKMNVSFTQLMSVTEKALTTFTTSEKKRFYCDNAKQFYEFV